MLIMALLSSIFIYTALQPVPKAVYGVPGYNYHKQHKVSLVVGSIVARRSEANWSLGRPPALAV
jgi:hypothetical protein